MGQPTQRRKMTSLILDPTFQVRLWVQSSAIALIGVATLVFAYIYSNFLLFEEMHGLYGQTVPVHQYYQGFKISSVILVALLVFIAVINFVYSLKVSHRVIGPIYRMQSYLEDVLAGKNESELRLREGDHFGELAELINRVCQEQRSSKDELV